MSGQFELRNNDWNLGHHQVYNDRSGRYTQNSGFGFRKFHGGIRNVLKAKWFYQNLSISIKGSLSQKQRTHELL